MTHSTIDRNESEGEARFPSLYQFLGCYFHQDYDIVGDTLEEIMAVCRAEVVPSEFVSIVQEIHRFIAMYGSTLEGLNAALELLFEPQVFIDGWDGMNSRQWLERIAELAMQDKPALSQNPTDLNSGSADMAKYSFLTYPTKEAEGYPELTSVLQSYFHRDSIIFGDNLQEIMEVCRADFSPKQMSDLVSRSTDS